MKHTKKRIAVMAVLTALLVALSGCGSQQQTESTATVEKKGQMAGILKSFMGKTLVLEEAGEAYTFDASEATVNTLNMRSGDQLVISYDGELQGNDTSAVKVTHIEDRGNHQEQKVQRVVGTLVELTENTVTIRQNDGVYLQFNANNCEHEFKNGIREGNWLSISYIGEIQGTDTTNVTVLKITDNDPNRVEKAQRTMKIKAVDQTMYATAGVHVRESYTLESKVIGSVAKGRPIKCTGVSENGWSRVAFHGRDGFIYGEYLTPKQPKANAKPAKIDGKPALTPQNEDKPNEPEPIRKPESDQIMEITEKEAAKSTADKPSKKDDPGSETEKKETQETKAVKPTKQPEPETVETTKQQEPEATKPPKQQKPKEISGVVKDVSMNTVTVSKDGKKYTFNIMDAEHEYANGIQTGNEVTIIYIGNLDEMEDVITLKVKDADPNEAASEAEYTGTIVDGTMNTITIETDDGAIMTFNKEDAEDDTEGDYVDTRVTITADVTEAEAEETILKAEEIEKKER